MSGYFIKVGDLSRHQLLGAGGNLQFETIECNLGASFPSPNIEGVLRPPDNLLAGDDITARIRAGSLRDPDLPVDLFRPKSKVVAFDPVDHTASEVLRIINLRHQLFVG